MQDAPLSMAFGPPERPAGGFTGIGRARQLLLMLQRIACPLSLTSPKGDAFILARVASVDPAAGMTSPIAVRIRGRRVPC